MNHRFISFVYILTAISIYCTSCDKEKEEHVVNPIPISSISIISPLTEMRVGETCQLVVRISPDNADSSTLIWSSSDAAIATVSSTGFVAAISPGTVSISVRVLNGETSADCEIRVYPIPPKTIDLGLSVLWSSCNLGANVPEEAGDYYSWGEVQPKTDYFYWYYKFYNNSIHPEYWDNDCLLKYYHDGRVVLEGEDDAAYASLGLGWRIPTYEEFEELINECKWEYVSSSESIGYSVIGPNGNSIFIPTAGAIIEKEPTALDCCFYWSSSKQYYLFSSSGGRGPALGAMNPPFFGMSIRPVKNYAVDAFSIDSKTIVAYPDKEFYIPTSIQPSNIRASSLNWNSSDETVVRINKGIAYPVSVGAATVFAIDDSGLLKDECSITVKNWGYSAPESVDLGLSVRWATCNLGATSPEEDGDRFAWGEVAHKSFFSENNYLLYDGNGSLIKYSITDAHSTLGKQDDAASVLLGEDWRIPTKEEIDELIENCEWTLVKTNGIEGYNISRNGNSIFLPKTVSPSYNQNCSYYSSSLFNDKDASILVLYSLYNLDNHQTTECFDLSSTRPWVGMNIRPVRNVPTDDIHFNVNTLYVPKGEKSSQLYVRIKPFNASGNISLSISDSNIASYSIENKGNVSEGIAIEGLSEGETIISAIAGDGKMTAECKIIVQDWMYPIAEAVDLGLSVKWASWNMGARSPEDFGDYFAWGETEHKTSFTWESYKFYPFVKYQGNTKDLNNPDGLYSLEPDDDVASVKWGSSWHIPSVTEWNELFQTCTVNKKEYNGVEGLSFTAQNGNSIFIPAAGVRYDDKFANIWSPVLNYWSNEINPNNYYSSYCVFGGGDGASAYYDRYYGFSIRPVFHD